MSSIDDYKVGMLVYGKISGIKPYGAFVKFDDDVNGLIHISEISSGFVRDINNFVCLDDYVTTKVIDIDKEHKQLRLSFKALKENSRRQHKMVKFYGMPNNKLGFSTISNMMPKWLEGKYDD